jgi:hypothetical protein
MSYILCPFGIVCGHFGIFSPVLESCTKKNLATLHLSFLRSHFIPRDEHVSINFVYQLTCGELESISDPTVKILLAILRHKKFADQISLSERDST